MIIIKTAFAHAESGQRPHLNLGTKENKTNFVTLNLFQGLAHGKISREISKDRLHLRRWSSFTIGQMLKRVQHDIPSHVIACLTRDLPSWKCVKAQVAFTLAETLIALAVIGIVAALTIPSLVSSYKKKHYASSLQKFYTVMTQAISISEIDNGYADTWTREAMKEPDGTIDQTKNKDRSLRFITKYILPYIKYSKVEKDVPLTYLEQNLIVPKVYLNDGTHFYAYNGNCIDFFYDVNGDKKPNSDGIDRYRFLFCGETYWRNVYLPSVKQCFGTYADHSASTQNYREHIKDLCTTNPRYCSELLRLDNWEYKSDYPHKI